ncbi:MAG: hypothetical protein F4053_13660 [Proteobacteria bacterium]|nr:hypothetical protein [Pseudomonadota bacterium]MYJ96585.1 hypothetical protein [Pseudomonadota bacterium]
MTGESREETYLRHARGRFTDAITFSLRWDANGNLVYPKTRKAQIAALELEVGRERLPDGSLTGKGRLMQAHLDYILGQPKVRGMKIATWNIDGVRAKEGALLRWLREQKPDLVALQKIKVSEDEFPTATFDRVGYHAEAHCNGPKDFGVAILCRKKNGTKPRVVQKGLDGQEELGARLLTVDVEGLEFSSVYAPYGTCKDIQPKLDWFECLIEHLRSRRSRSEQQVLCGDFNVLAEWRVGPGGPPKYKSPVFCKEVRAKFRKLLESAGLLDLYERRPPDCEDPFIFEGKQARLKFSRLEYVLGTPGVADRDPVVRFDFEYSIIKNGPFPWVRAPIVADLGD